MRARSGTWWERAASPPGHRSHQRGPRVVHPPGRVRSEWATTRKLSLIASLQARAEIGTVQTGGGPGRASPVFPPLGGGSPRDRAVRPGVHGTRCNETGQTRCAATTIPSRSSAVTRCGSMFALPATKRILRPRSAASFSAARRVSPTKSGSFGNRGEYGARSERGAPNATRRCVVRSPGRRSRWGAGTSRRTRARRGCR
jgi:hypothetical protein